MTSPSRNQMEFRSVSVAPAEWVWLAASMLLSLTLRVPFLRMPMLADEGGYAWATRGWVEGTGSLYGDLWISRPQGIFFVYAGILDLFGNGTVAFRFAAWVAIALTTIAVWAYTRLWKGPRAAVLAAIFFAILSSLPNLEGYSANAEMFMGCPAAFAALWLLWIGRTGWSRWQLLGVGVLMGIAISLKPSAASMWPVALIFIFLIADHGSAKSRIARCVWLSGGIGLVGGLSLIHGWWLGWNDFVYATMTYRLHAQSAVTVGLLHNLEAIARLAWRISSLIVLSGILLILDYRRRLNARRLQTGHLASNPVHRERLLADDGRVLLTLWMIAAFVGASIGGDWWAHYLIQMAAPLAIWMAVTLEAIWPSVGVYSRIGIVVIVGAFLLNPFWVIGYRTPDRMARAMFSHPGYAAQADIAAWLRANSEPGTTIYVAFDQASIYYLANRPPAYRHLYDQELRGIPSSYTDLITIIRSDNRPRFIVATRQPGPFADASRAFWQEVGNYYEVVTTIDGVPIYQDRDTIESQS